MSEASAESANLPAQDIRAALGKLERDSMFSSWQDLMGALQAATESTYESRYELGQGEEIPPTVTLEPLNTGQPREDQFQPIVILTVPIQIKGSARGNDSLVVNSHEYIGITPAGAVAVSFEQRGYNPSKTPREAGGVAQENQFRLGLVSVNKETGIHLPASGQGYVHIGDMPPEIRFENNSIFTARPVDLGVVQEAIKVNFPSL